jgi:hypothetical protein
MQLTDGTAEAARMTRPLEPRDIGKRRYWGTAGVLGFVMGLVVTCFTKSDSWLIGGVVIGLLGGFLVAAIRGSDEL